MSKRSEKRKLAPYYQQELATSRAWKVAHREQIKRARAEHYQKNKDKELAMARAWRAANPELNKSIKAKSDQQYRINNGERLREYKQRQKPRRNLLQRQRYHADVNFNIEKRLRNSMEQSIRRLGISKATSFIKLLGCTVEELMAHIEKQFRPGMTWENRRTWHIDHKKPCAAFNLTDPDEQIACFHFSNLQPLWAIENFRKGAKWPVSETKTA